jgi:ketosteroid isomerase-like protein
MTQTPTEDILAGYFSALRDRDLDRIASYFAEDIVYTDVCLHFTGRGRREVKRSFRLWFDTVAGAYAPTINDLQVAPGGYVLEWTLRYDFSGTLGLLSGQGPLELKMVSVGHIRDGLIVDNRDYWDLATVLRQFGIATVPPLPPSAGEG